MDGTRATTPQGFWKRTTQYGLPTRWFAAWLMGAFLQLALVVQWVPGWWGWKVGGGVALVLVELALGAYATHFDAQWDTLRLEQWRRGYRRYYDAM